MKIVYDHQIFAMQEHGGVSRYFVELAKQLSTRPDIELTVLAPLHFNSYLEDAGLNTAHGIRVPKFPASGKLVNLLNDLIVHNWLGKNEPDIFHATYYSPTKSRRINKSKVVVTVYDMIHELYSGDFASYDRTAQLKQKAVLKSDHVICISHNTRKDLIQFSGVDPTKVSVVHLGTNQIVPAPVTEFKPPQMPYLLFVGKRDGYKNFSGLLKAFAICKDLNTHFNLVCFGGGNFSSRELSMQKKLGLNPTQTQWFGGGDAILGALYKNATAFIYPSLYEGFGMPPLEAMSLSCPVVCSNGGSIPEIVGDAGEFFDPQITEDICRAILRVVSDSLYSAELRLKGTDQIKKYSWLQCAQETLEVYQSLN